MLGTSRKKLKAAPSKNSTVAETQSGATAFISFAVSAGDTNCPTNNRMSGDDIKAPLAKAPLAVAVLVAVMLVGPMIPVAGHVVISPSDVPGNGANMPR